MKETKCMVCGKEFSKEELTEFEGKFICKACREKIKAEYTDIRPALAG